MTLPTPGPGQLLWFIVVGVEGTTESGHGFDGGARERPLSGVGFCGVTQSMPGPVCRVFDE